VIFTGKVTNVEELINACDFGFLLTYCEGIPNTLMEFMALKKPVIATNGGGTNELVAHNESGFLIENNDLDEIVEKTNYLLNNEDIRLQMGENGYQIILKEFSLEKMGESFLKVYNEFQSK
jgi:glycosyltransferase involved in cell wall biosynthesis